MNRTRFVCRSRILIRIISSMVTWIHCECVTAPPQGRRTTHISAEQKRRTHIKFGFKTLCSLVPALKSQSNVRGTSFTCAAFWCLFHTNALHLSPSSAPPLSSLSLYRPVTRWRCKRRWSTLGNSRWSGSRCRRRWSGCGKRLKSSTRPSGGAGVIQPTQRLSAEAEVMLFFVSWCCISARVRSFCPPPEFPLGHSASITTRNSVTTWGAARYKTGSSGSYPSLPAVPFTIHTTGGASSVKLLTQQKYVGSGTRHIMIIYLLFIFYFLLFIYYIHIFILIYQVKVKIEQGEPKWSVRERNWQQNKMWHKQKQTIKN